MRRFANRRVGSVSQAISLRRVVPVILRREESNVTIGDGSRDDEGSFEKAGPRYLGTSVGLQGAVQGGVQLTGMTPNRQL